MPAYFELLHGRKLLGKDDNGNRFWEHLDDWGADGPILGPFDFVHSTYGSRLQLGNDAELQIVDDLVYYDGIGYGDFSVCDESQSRLAGLMERRQEFEQLKSEIGPISQTYVIALHEDESNSPLYYYDDDAAGRRCRSWTADIDFATAFTYREARHLAVELARAEYPLKVTIACLQFIPLESWYVRSDLTVTIETVRICPERNAELT